MIVARILERQVFRAPTRMLHMLLCAAVLACVSCNHVKASEFEGNPVRALPIVEQTCSACHGSDGNSPNVAIPSLAGQFPEYLFKQLTQYKGLPGLPRRENPIMAEIVKPLSLEDMHNLAVYFSSQPAKPAPIRDSGRLDRGRSVYLFGNAANDLPACVTCHRPDGAGIRPDFPRVGGQQPEYIENQLLAWKNGTRAEKVS
jgi:cytochrome c553